MKTSVPQPPKGKAGQLSLNKPNAGRYAQVVRWDTAPVGKSPPAVRNPARRSYALERYLPAYGEPRWRGHRCSPPEISRHVEVCPVELVFAQIRPTRQAGYHVSAG